LILLIVSFIALGIQLDTYLEYLIYCAFIMSLRNYLFTLIGSLILLLSLFQMAFIFWAQSNFEQQVQEKAEQVSMQFIEFAVENFEAPKVKIIAKNSKKPVKHFVIETENLISDVIINNDTDSNSEISENSIDVNQIRKSLHKSIEKLHKNTEVIQKSQTTSDHNQWQFENTVKLDDDNKLNSFVNMVAMVIFLSTVIALAFAFWLSAKFSQPMQALSLGFRQLSNGETNDDIIEQGVEETRQTIRDFNAMKDKLLQLSIAEKAFQQKSHLAELGEVSLGLAHALRNPIHTIGLSVEQLNSYKLNNTQRQNFVDKIQAKINHIDKTIRALLTLTTTGIQRTDKVNILTVTQDILLEYKASDNLKLNFVLNIDKNLQIIANENEVRAILHTLIINACEASSEQQTITINAELANNELKVVVEDHGIGLSDKISDNLFQPHITNKAEGAGMGLYIAQRLVRLFYQGEIQLANNQEKGCIATVTFSAAGINHER